MVDKYENIYKNKKHTWTAMAIFLSKAFKTGPAVKTYRIEELALTIVVDKNDKINYISINSLEDLVSDMKKLMKKIKEK